MLKARDKVRLGTRGQTGKVVCVPSRGEDG